MNITKGNTCDIKEGDIVTRHSYHHDVFFKVVSTYVTEDGSLHARLKGLDIRLEATAPLDDLITKDPKEVCLFWSKLQLCHKEKVENILKERISYMSEK